MQPHILDHAEIGGLCNPWELRCGPPTERSIGQSIIPVKKKLKKSLDMGQGPFVQLKRIKESMEAGRVRRNHKR